MMRRMSEISEPTTSRPTTAVTTPTTVVEAAQPNRLYQAAAWVAIIAGIVFIAAVLFFSGARLAGHGCHHGHHGHHWHQHSMVHPGHRHGPGTVSPGGPGVSPGNEPGQPPQAVIPSTAPPRR
jgi:hypothetical protein